MKVPPAKFLWIIGVVVLLVAIATPSYILYRQNQDLKKQVLGEKSEEGDIKALVDRVAKLILLPTGETPTVMTVTDREKLTNQAFFANAKNGDKVLVYQEAKKAFLFDPDRGIVLEVGPVTFNATASGTTTTGGLPTPAGSAPSPATASATVRFYLLNGAVTARLTQRYEPVLKEKVPGAEVVDRGNAEATYPVSRIVDLTGSNTELVNTYAKVLGLTVGPLPDGEIKPDADFLILLGTDVAESL